jgi:hypothetical protein
MSTRTHTDVLGPDDTFTVQVDPSPGGNRSLTLTVSTPDAPQPEPEPPAETLRVGVEVDTFGDSTAALLARYTPRFLREYGFKRTGESLPSLSPHSSSRFTGVPQDVALHQSWKTDVNRLAEHLTTATRPAYYTWWHEPMDGDVTPANYRATAAKIAPIVAASGKSNLVLGHGPCLTAWWLVEKNGNPLDYWYDGANVFSLDLYGFPPYPSALALVKPALDKIRSALPGVRIIVSEYGLKVGGTGRAAAIKDHVDYLRAQPDVDAVAYWDSYVTDADYRLPAGSPESIEWQRQCSLSA